MTVHHIIARDPMYAIGFIIAAPTQKSAINLIKENPYYRNYSVEPSSMPVLNNCVYNGYDTTILLSYRI